MHQGLRNLVQLASCDWYLFVSASTSTSVRGRARPRLEPVPELMAEIHDGDPLVRADWPWHWWGLEPLDRSRKDWQTRYASVFRAASYV